MRRVLRAIVARSARRVLATRRDARDRPGTDRWTAEAVRQLLAETERWAERLRPTARLDALPSVGNRLMVEAAVLTTAAYRALLDEGQSREAATGLVADIGWDVYADSLKLASLPARITTSNPGERLQRTIRLLLRFPFSAAGPNGYQVESWTEDDRIFTHWTRCPPQEMVRRVIVEQGDRGDLEAFRQSWCRYDWPGADLIAADGRTGHYRRTRTLSHGDAVCDMCWLGTPAKPGGGQGSESARQP
ncbi:L-2-amino-thiazoline-4-carboxylic acid hydrolase [Aurantimonas marianensis]|uniref:L-2-amino-thiazoline-4-carboxylic acid hydrolase n=1 Tax=Aurantimonas marianensis TaxID=2920428 RepID=A0A9X2KE84_9HYPH|nr:L-2-amino-thiazoline-4-carboxylic acid hydrolase [Aurantimonas marianensis]MCP3054399.1 L-2-amino-thiazoline-4-carboxylic acid hydrolase [Aurantimonas marianensis]